MENEARDNRLILTPKTLIEKRLAEGLDDLKRGREGIAVPSKTS
jgi:hypothetical protein